MHDFFPHLPLFNEFEYVCKDSKGGWRCKEKAGSGRVCGASDWLPHGRDISGDLTPPPFGVITVGDVRLIR